MSKSYIPDTLNQLTIETGGMKRKCKYHRNLWLNQKSLLRLLLNCVVILEIITGILLSMEELIDTLT